MNLYENLRGLELRDWRLLQGQVVEPVRLQEAVLAGRCWERHDGETRFDRVDVMEYVCVDGYVSPVPLGICRYIVAFA